jgi:hypothetical protein
MSVIGEGSYGCIHRPSLTCKNKKMSYKKKVSKILLNKYAIKELKQYVRIAKVDKKNKFNLGKPLQCKVENTKKNLKAIKGCEEYNHMIDNLEDYNLLVMNDGGVDIDIYVEKMNKMKMNKNVKKKIDIFYSEFLRIFQGCELFLKHNIINHDVKPQNIVYDESTNRMNFIDFGLMQSYNDVVSKLHKSDFWLANHAHWSYPIEIQFLNKNKYDHFIKKSEDEKVEYYEKIINNINQDIDTYNTNTIKTLFSYIMPKTDKNVFSNRYLNDILFLLKTDLTAKSYNDFIKKSLDTIDLYGIGLTILYSINMLHELMDKNLYKDLFDFGYNLVTPRLYERYSCSEATSKYKEILEKHNILKHKYIKIHKTLKNLKNTSLNISHKKRYEIIHENN